MIPLEVQELLNDYQPDRVKDKQLTFQLGPKDCEKILQSPEAVSALLELLGGDVGVELYALELTDEVLEALERGCEWVDEL
jgi:hypothetical protein